MMPALLRAMSSRPERGDGLVDGVGDLVFRGEIAGDAEDLAAGRAQLGGCRAPVPEIVSTRLLSTFATAGLKMLLVRGFGWLVVH
jgi:hypothetical protein